MQKAIDTGSIEKALKDKAKEEAIRNFQRDSKNLLKDGYSGTWNEHFRHEDYKELIRLLDIFMQHVVVPVAQAKAIRTFLTSYQELLTAMPHLLQASDAPDVLGDEF